jgi:curved DNA-binding protein CbpA
VHLEADCGRPDAGRVLRRQVYRDQLDLADLLQRHALSSGANTASTEADSIDSGGVVRLSTARASASMQEANTFDLYKVLGISSGASALEIKMAFRKLAKALHPDCNAGDRIAERQFAAVHEAYTILGNAELRAVYDREFERIRLAAEAQPAEQESGKVAKSDRGIWHEVVKVTVATAVLTACFATGLSIWQRNSSGLERNHAALAEAGPPKAHIPSNLSSEELAEALFGSQAPRYGNPPAATSAEAITTVSVPAVVGSEAKAVSVEAATPGSAVKTVSVGAAAPGSETSVSGVSATVIEPSSLAAAAEVAIAVEPDPAAREAAAPAARSRELDQAARVQAERLIGLGERHLADGNVAIARQYFARAYDLGYVQAATRLAETFEAEALARHGVHGVKPDPVEAQKWRKRAAGIK